MSIRGLVNKFINKVYAVPKIIEQTNKEASDTFLKMVEEGFAKEKDPEGNSWAKKKKPNGYNILSSARNNLRGSIKSEKIDKYTFRLYTGVPYGRFHMSGTSKMPARPFLPDPNTKKYVMKYKQIFQKYFDKYYKV